MSKWKEQYRNIMQSQAGTDFSTPPAVTYLVDAMADHIKRLEDELEGITQELEAHHFEMEVQAKRLEAFKHKLKAKLGVKDD